MKNVVRFCFFVTLFLVAPYTFAQTHAPSNVPLPTCEPDDPQCTPQKGTGNVPLPTCQPGDPQCVPLG